MPQVDLQYAPKFALGEMAIYGGAVVRVIGREQFIPHSTWFYLLGCKIGKHKMIWHKRVLEDLLEKPDPTNILELNKRR